MCLLYSCYAGSKCMYSYLLLCMLGVRINKPADKKIDSEKYYIYVGTERAGHIRIEISQSVQEGRLRQDTAKVSFMC